MLTTQNQAAEALRSNNAEAGGLLITERSAQAAPMTETQLDLHPCGPRSDTSTLSLRDVQLDLLATFGEWCRRYGLPYVVTHGTALGAVRHQGFIPWDDDIDVAMPREAFDRFISMAPQDLPDRYFVQHSTTDPDFVLPMAKLRRQGSVFLEDNAADVRIHHGIFIDVFPLDRKPTNLLAQRAHVSSVRLLSRLARIRSGYVLNRSGALVRRLAGPLSRLLRLLPPWWLTSTRDWLLVLPRSGSGSLTIVAGPYGYDREYYSPEWLDSLVDVPFEHLHVPVFRAVDEYLTRLYGDYQQLPPAHLRVSPHASSRIELPMERVGTDPGATDET